jgi:V-type H+-transporting ATPase subunit d
MEGLFFNVNNGYVVLIEVKLMEILTVCSYIEGIVRGYRNSLLTGQNYSNLTQCETIDGRMPPPSCSPSLTNVL